MKIELRPYQEDIVKRMLWDMNNSGNSVISLAQGGGKSHIIAEFAKRLDKPVLILTPNKELLEQDLDKLQKEMPDEKIGVYSASMNSKEVERITIGTIQSIHKNPEKFTGFDVVIVDEMDLVNPTKLDTTYRKLFIQAKIKKIFGLTGTPYRQDVVYEYPPNYRGTTWQKMQIKAITTTKMVTRYKGLFWSRMLVAINTADLLKHGYLSPIEYHDVSLIQHEAIPTNKSKSDFDLEAFDNLMFNRYTKIAEFIKTLPHKAKIVYCSSIQQANALQSLIKGSMVVTSETNKKSRENAVKSLREGKLSVLLNVGVFTVGFDYPSLDCVVLLRPTRSLRLHCQILGRVSRIAEGKKMGHVYDFVSNVKNLGTLVDIRVAKDHTGKWNVISSSSPGGFHLKPLYSYTLRRSDDRND